MGDTAVDCLEALGFPNAALLKAKVGAPLDGRDFKDIVLVKIEQGQTQTGAGCPHCFDDGTRVDFAAPLEDWHFDGDLVRRLDHGISHVLKPCLGGVTHTARDISDSVALSTQNDPGVVVYARVNPHHGDGCGVQNGISSNFGLVGGA